MRSLEDILRPPLLAQPRSRDVLGVAMLASLAVAMLPALGIHWLALFSSSGGHEEVEQLFRRVTGPMTRIYLPMALGVVLCLRCGAVDLSIWSASGLGGVVAAVCINGGWYGAPSGQATADSLHPWMWLSPAAALPLGMLAGTGVGLLNAVLTAALRVPSALATAGVGLAIVLLLHGAPVRQVEVPQEAFGSWHITQHIQIHPSAGAPAEIDDETLTQPLQVTRMLLAAILYAATIGTLLGIEWWAPGRIAPASRWRLAAAMAASGALAGAAGALWLLDRGSAPVPTHLVDDPLPFAAALLAGGAFFGGRSRTLLACLCLPAALLVATLWQEKILLAPQWGFAAGTITLIVLLLAVHQPAGAFSSGPLAGRKLPLAAALFGMAGVVLVGASAAIESPLGRHLFIVAGLCLWLVGAVLTLVTTLRGHHATIL